MGCNLRLFSFLAGFAFNTTSSAFKTTGCAFKTSSCVFKRPPSEDAMVRVEVFCRLRGSASSTKDSSSRSLISRPVRDAEGLLFSSRENRRVREVARARPNVRFRLRVSSCELSRDLAKCLVGKNCAALKTTAGRRYDAGGGGRG